jgi:hypothetical protein
MAKTPTNKEIGKGIGETKEIGKGIGETKEIGKGIGETKEIGKGAVDLKQIGTLFDALGASLDGWLIVSFVAPVRANGSDFVRPNGASAPPFEALRRYTREKDQRDTAKLHTEVKAIQSRLDGLSGAIRYVEPKSSTRAARAAGGPTRSRRKR